MAESFQSGDSKKTVIWDLPVRIFHWLLVLSFAIAWITHENDRFLFHHVYVGYLFIGLLLFRLMWGMFGSQHARFRSFAHDWPTVTAYLKGLLDGTAERYIGHNPAGGWAIFLMILLGFIVTITGLLVLGGEEGHGPLKGIVSYELGHGSKEIHEASATFMLMIVFVHLAGVVVESIFHKENLVWSMITGKKVTDAGTPGVHVYPLVAVLILAVVTSSALYYFRGYIKETKDQPFLAYTHDPLPMNDTWQSECGDCHMAFHPSLLPERSWEKIFKEQDHHFDEDLALDEDTVAELLKYAQENSSEHVETEPAHNMMNTIPKDVTPIRITETRYWKHKHDEIKEKYWKASSVKSKLNCPACHLDAKQGWFEDSNMRLPELDRM